MNDSNDLRIFLSINPNEAINCGGRRVVFEQVVQGLGGLEVLEKKIVYLVAFEVSFDGLYADYPKRSTYHKNCSVLNGDPKHLLRSFIGELRKSGEVRLTTFLNTVIAWPITQCSPHFCLSYGKKIPFDHSMKRYGTVKTMSFRIGQIRKEDIFHYRTPSLPLSISQHL